MDEHVKYFEIGPHSIVNRSAATNAFMMTSNAFIILQKLDFMGYYLPLGHSVNVNRFQAIINFLVRFSKGAHVLSDLDRAAIIHDFPHVRRITLNLFLSDEEGERREMDSRILGESNPLSAVHAQRNRIMTKKYGLKPCIREQQSGQPGAARAFWEKDWSRHKDEPLSFTGLPSCLWINDAQRQQSAMLKAMLNIIDLHMAELHAMMTDESGDDSNFQTRPFFPFFKAGHTLRVKFFELRGLRGFTKYCI